MLLLSQEEDGAECKMGWWRGLFFSVPTSNSSNCCWWFNIVCATNCSKSVAHEISDTSSLFLAECWNSWNHWLVYNSLSNTSKYRLAIQSTIPPQFKCCQCPPPMRGVDPTLITCCYLLLYTVLIYIDLSFICHISSNSDVHFMSSQDCSSGRSLAWPSGLPDHRTKEIRCAVVDFSGCL